MTARKVPVEISARHVHLSAVHLAALFGPSSTLGVLKEISQPGQFAAQETVTVIGPQGELGARVVGPVREATQVELTSTECWQIGLPVVLRVSGNLAGTPGCRLRGPAGEVELSEGVVVVQRHLHISPEQAKEWKLKHGDTVSIATSGNRPVTFHDVYVRSRSG
ncbi:MAG: PduL/EutD family phosphate acyltransferase, partial [Candidatus Veblenbacteria bacterium]|nr:PduL/EutD family phosphate acyltransferase [Candidatus Veblenbacteria bacterium]